MIDRFDSNEVAARRAIPPPGRSRCGSVAPRIAASLLGAGLLVVLLTRWLADPNAGDDRPDDAVSRSFQTLPRSFEALPRSFEVLPRSFEVLPRSFEVRGSSMVPTLLGEFHTGFCSSCQLGWLVDAANDVMDANSLTCPHCGGPMSLDNGREVEEHARTAVADTVTIDPIANDAAGLQGLRRGELVSVRSDGQLHVKRVVGVPGDRVSLDRLRLLVNGNRIEDGLQSVDCRFPVPWMLVDDDVHRRQTRWSEVDKPIDGQRAWSRVSDGTWRCAATGSRPWLRYEHRNIHRGDLPSPVWDDYSFNVHLSRTLFPVDRLRVRGQADSDVELEVAFWSERGSVALRLIVAAGQSFIVSSLEGVPTDGLPVSEERPVALRMGSELASVRGLIIERLVEYRLRPHDDRQRYPIQLGANEWFLLGDNVPVSVDSRDWGAVTDAMLLGRVQRREPAYRALVFPVATPR